MMKTKGNSVIKLLPIGSNQTELHLGDDVAVFFSYDVPVAAFVSGKGYLRSEEKYSKTTSKHVNQWLKRYAALNRALPVPQYQIDALVSVVKVA